MTRGIAYCTNVLPGADLASAVRAIEERATRVRELVVPNGVLGLGLWLSDRAAREFDDDAAPRLRDRWAERGLAVVGLNGFPFGDFHAERVKHAVYEPDWTNPERSAYTLRLAGILIDLLPPGVASASISTLPLGWRTSMSADAIDAASAQLRLVGRELARIESERGVRLTLDLEPEPGCALDRPDHVVSLFERSFTDDHCRRHLGVCHDVCHAAVMFDDQAEALATYRKHGIRVGKVQVSSALACDGTEEALQALARFDEPRYLHQTCVLEGPGRVRFFDDLPDALPMLRGRSSRTHFHVPIHLERIGPLATTQRAIEACLANLSREDPPSIEVETYAWSALPEELRPADLTEGIAAELRWLAERLEP